MESLFPPLAAAVTTTASATFLCALVPCSAPNHEHESSSCFSPSKLSQRQKRRHACTQTRKRELAIVRLLIHIPGTYHTPTFACPPYRRGSVNYKHTRHLNCNRVFCDSSAGLIGRNSSSVLSTDQITDTRRSAMNRAAFQKVAIA